MGIVNLMEVWSGRVVEEELESQRVKYNRIFLVQVDDPTDAEVTILTPDPEGVYLVPELGDIYQTNSLADGSGDVVEEDPDAICKRRSARQGDEGWMWWQLTCEYDTDAPDPAKEEANPLNRTPDVERGMGSKFMGGRPWNRCLPVTCFFTGFAFLILGTERRERMRYIGALRRAAHGRLDWFFGWGTRVRFGTLRALAGVLTWCAGHAEDMLFTLALASIAYGCWLAWRPLGFIAPGLAVAGLLVYSRVQASRKPAHRGDGGD